MSLIHNFIEYSIVAIYHIFRSLAYIYLLALLFFILLLINITILSYSMNDESLTLDNALNLSINSNVGIIVLVYSLLLSVILFIYLNKSKNAKSILLFATSVLVDKIVSFLSILTGVGRDKKQSVYSSSYTDDHLVKLIKNTIFLEKNSIYSSLAIDEDELVIKLSDKLRANINNSIINDIEQRHGNEFIKTKKIELVDNIFELIIEKLSNERQTLTLWTFINLFSGVFAAILGVYLLYGMVGILNDHENPSEGIEFLIIIFASRLSIAVIIEIFAYFFLNLYRSGMQEIKYYQNEITNILSRQAGVRAAFMQENENAISNAIKQLIETERNFILKKGETTINLEQNRIDREADSQLASTIANAVKLGIQKARVPATSARKKKSS